MVFKHIKSRPSQYLLFAVIPFSLLIFACGGGQGSSCDSTSGEGSLSLKLVWESDSDLTSTQAAPSGNVCDDYDIETIEITVRDSSGTEVAAASPLCSSRATTLDVPAGSGMTVSVDGIVAGNPDWQGQQIDISVQACQNTPITGLQMYYFGDDEIPPTVSNPDPASGATGVALDSDITATFSEPVVPASVNTSSCTVFETGTINQVTCTVSYEESTNIVTIIPSSHLAANLGYTATITMEVQDKAGIQMASDYSWNFTTGGPITQSLIWNDGNWNETVWN